MIALVVIGAFLKLWAIIVLNGDFEFYWALYFMLQLICNFEIYKTQLPQSADCFIQKLHALVRLDFINI